MEKRLQMHCGRVIGYKRDTVGWVLLTIGKQPVVWIFVEQKRNLMVGAVKGRKTNPLPLAAYGAMHMAEK
tara:strand:+ start:904 stop:1113 length:210 start_codon:yes stop_codon:yes gene_type:complete